MDQREALLAMYADSGPETRAAVEFGIDVSLIDEALQRTPWERIQQLDEMIRFAESLRGAMATNDAAG